jgi:hypothetical protein
MMKNPSKILLEYQNNKMSKSFIKTIDKRKNSQTLQDITLYSEIILMKDILHSFFHYNIEIN